MRLEEEGRQGRKAASGSWTLLRESLVLASGEIAAGMVNERLKSVALFSGTICYDRRSVGKSPRGASPGDRSRRSAMRLTSKCLVVALSALFAATPAVPAAAMPLPVVKVQPVEAGTGAQLVDHRWGYRRHWRGGHRWGRYEGRRWYPRGRYDDWRGGRYGYYHGYRHRHRSDAWVPLAILG